MSIFDRDGNEVVAAIVLDREAVRAALDSAMIGVSCPQDDEGDDLDIATIEASPDRFIGLDGWIDLDRLIASLSGGQSS